MNLQLLPVFYLFVCLFSYIGFLNIWDLRTGKYPVHRFEHDARIQALALSQDDVTVATASAFDVVMLRPSEEGYWQITAEFEVQKLVSFLVWSLYPPLLKSPGLVQTDSNDVGNSHPLGASWTPSISKSWQPYKIASISPPFTRKPGEAWSSKPTCPITQPHISALRSCAANLRADFKTSVSGYWGLWLPSRS